MAENFTTFSTDSAIKSGQGLQMLRNQFDLPERKGSPEESDDDLTLTNFITLD